jgi:LysR family glycine cleavage system transcriptional activator
VLSIRRLPLGSLRVFLAVAQHLSFTRAADQLGVTPGAASLQIKALEEYLGKPLLRRDGREVNLTAEGAALLPRVSVALDDLEQALDETRAPRGGGSLRISMIASFLNKWLTPRLGDFQRANPGIRLTLVTSNDPVDFVRTEHDAAIRMGRGTWTALEREKILDEWLVPVCAAKLLEKHGPVDDSSRLRRYPILHSVSEPWSLWTQRDRIVDEDYAPQGSGTVYDDSAAILVAARYGLGLALARWSLVADEIARGELVVASQKPLLNRRAYWFVYPKRSRVLPSIAAFQAWFQQQAAIFPKPSGAAS